MKEKNTELFNKIKEARNIEEKVHLGVEYFENTCNMHDDMYTWMNIDQIKEILNIVGSHFYDKTQRPINEDYLSDLCELIEEGQFFNYDNFGERGVGRDVKNLEYKIANKLLAIFRGIIKRNYRVYVSEAFKQINHKFEKSYICVIPDDLFDDSDIYDSLCPAYDEYNLQPGDEGYEFSISEALDNMYGK